MSGLTFGQNVSNDSTCVGITSKGLDCKIKVNVDSTSLCHYHINGNITKKTSTQCGGISKSTNNRCRLKTKHESEFCHHHRNTN